MNKKIELRMLTQDALDELKFNFDKYSYLYKKENKKRRENFFKDNSVKTGIFFEVPELDLSDNFKESDLTNAKLIYESLKNLSQLMASDFRIWTYLCSTEFYEYVYKRYAAENKSMDENELVTKFLIPFCYKSTNGLSRSLATNYISRLWVVGHICENDGDYSLLNSFKGLPGKVVQIRSFANSKSLAQVILSTMLEFCENEQGRDYADRPTFELCFKQANIISSSRAIDFIPKNILKSDIYNMMKSSYISK